MPFVELVGSLDNRFLKGLLFVASLAALCGKPWPDEFAAQ